MTTLTHSKSRRGTLGTPVKAVLFDMDGTLVQLRTAGRMVVLNETLADFGKPPLTDAEQVERFWFTSERYAMIDSWEIARPEFWKAFDCERLLQLQLEHTYAYDDAGLSMARLRRLGLRLGIVSNSAHISLNPKITLLEEEIARQEIEVVVSCNDDVSRTKPWADGIDLALAKMNLRPEEVCFIGDSLDDLAGLAIAQQEFEKAAQLYAVSEKIRAKAGTRRESFLQSTYEKQLVKLHSQLDAASFDAAWARGDALELDRALALARSATYFATTRELPGDSAGATA
mgnify:CR=1 FL=1